MQPFGSGVRSRLVIGESGLERQRMGVLHSTPSLDVDGHGVQPYSLIVNTFQKKTSPHDGCII